MNFAATIAALQKENAALRGAITEAGLPMPHGSQANPEDSAALSTARLHATRDTLTVALKEANQNLASANAANAQLAQVAASQKADADNWKAKLATISAERDMLMAKLAAVENKIAEQVIERIAAAGVPAIARAGEASNGTKDAPESNGATGIARSIAAHRAG